MSKIIFQSNGIRRKTLRLINLNTVLIAVVLVVGLLLEGDLRPAAKDYKFWLTVVLVPIGLRTAMIFLFSIILKVREEAFFFESFVGGHKISVSEIRKIYYREFRHGIKRETGVKIKIFLLKGNVQHYTLYRGMNFGGILRRVPSLEVIDSESLTP